LRRSTLTEPDGRFRIDFVPSVPCNLNVIPIVEGDGQIRVAHTESMDVLAGESTSLDIKLDRLSESGK
jgi:hypothetical protein